MHNAIYSGDFTKLQLPPAKRYQRHDGNARKIDGVQPKTDK